MFNEGDRIIHPTKMVRGEVLEIYDGIAYIEMDNGVETDFPVDELMLESEYKSPDEIEKEKMEAADEEKKAIAERIWPNIRPVIADLTERCHANAMAAVSVLGGSGTSWDELTSYHKMNYLIAWSGISFDQWADAADVGKLDSIQLALMAQLGELANKAGLK